jgi:cellulose synthase/poly-beta-1,6-N-acetylglucosamine synthase-like glycosyltransferase
MPDTEYLGIFDDDTYFKGDMDRALLFLDGGENDSLKTYDAAALHVKPEISDNLNLIEAYQYHEYMMAMEQKKGMFGKKKQVMNISGCAGLYKKDIFKEVIKEQIETNNIFDGEDYWRTQRILSKGKEVCLVPKEIGVSARTEIPKTAKDLFKQRVNSWDPGRLKVAWEFKKDMLRRDRRSTELIYDSMFNILLEPFKIAALPSLVTSPVLIPFIAFYEGLEYYYYNRYFEEEDKKKLRKYIPLMPFCNILMHGVRTIGYTNGLKKMCIDYKKIKETEEEIKEEPLFEFMSEEEKEKELVDLERIVENNNEPKFK